jgi:predicted metal-dependent phosphoesterase TrpH
MKTTKNWTISWRESGLAKQRPLRNFGCEKLAIKIDLHVHTRYSIDSLITPKELVFYARKRGLDGVAVTDHDRLDSALKIAKETEFFIIPGMEITSSNGHIVALNIQEPVTKRLDADETVDRIHEAGGLAVACHPTALFKGSLRKHTSSRFDAIEVINASAFPFSSSVSRARQFASSLGIAQVAGTDAHYGPEIGCAYTLIDSNLSIDGVIKAISRRMCQPFGTAIPWKLRLKKEFLMFKENLGFKNRETGENG